MGIGPIWGITSLTFILSCINLLNPTKRLRTMNHSVNKCIRGLISEETVVLRRWAVETNVSLYQKGC